MLRPEGLQLNPVVPRAHEHMDFVFKAVVPAGASAVLNEVETDGFQWIPVKDVVGGALDTFPSVRYWLERLSG